MDSAGIQGAYGTFADTLRAGGFTGQLRALLP
jgi:hypothetical protein